MLISVLINIVINLVPWILAFVGIEQAMKSTESPMTKSRIRTIFALAALLLVIFSGASAIRSERETAALPARLAQYIKNTTPPIAFPVGWRPAPPTGLIASVGGDWGTQANNVANQLRLFLNERGDAPVRRPGESDVDFVVRSNSWYSSVMNQYRKQFGDEVANLERVLIEKGVADPQILDLAKDPVNPIGVRTLVIQLSDAAVKFSQKYGPLEKRP